MKIWSYFTGIPIPNGSQICPSTSGTAENGPGAQTQQDLRCLCVCSRTEEVTHHSLLLQVRLVSNQHHGEVVSVLHSQDLGVELLDLMVADGRRRRKTLPPIKATLHPLWRSWGWFEAEDCALTAFHTSRNVRKAVRKLCECKSDRKN